MKSNLRHIFHFSILFLSFFLYVASCSRQEYVRESGMIWNTSFHVTFRGPESLADSVLKTLDLVGKSLNVFDSTSVVSRVNVSDSLPVDSHFIKVYMASLLISEKSGGMFDPTLSPLITAWGFGKGHTATADTAAVDSVLRFVGIRKTRLKGNMIVKDDRRTEFNFSAIAKGYGCDMVGETFRRNGVSDYLVEIGGEITAGGKGPNGNGWRISIDKPIVTDSVIHESQTIIDITDCGMATSGNYRNFHRQNGLTFGHTISPVTGRPVATDIISATVIAPSCMEADAAATACMALPSSKAKEMLKALNFSGMLVLSDSTVWTTSHFPIVIHKE